MKWLAIFFALLLVVIVIAADLGELPGFLKSIYDIPYGDKIGHFILVGILSFFTNASLLRDFPHRNPLRIVLTVNLILAALIGIEEFTQRFFPRRTSSLFDLLSSYAGIAFFAWLAWSWKIKQKS